MSTATTHLVIGPEHHGRKMSLAEFENAEGREGHIYELSRGVVTVNQVPNYRHLLQVNAIHRQLSAFDLANPKQVFCIAAGSDCKILLQDLQSERHPDLSVYKTPPPKIEGGDVWPIWVPELVIEVVSTSSADRDYNEKPQEYLQFGVSEYWIIDIEQQQMTVLQRTRGTWATARNVKPRDTYSTHLLPGMDFNCQAVFDAAGTG